MKSRTLSNNPWNAYGILVVRRGAPRFQLVDGVTSTSGPRHERSPHALPATPNDARLSPVCSRRVPPFAPVIPGSYCFTQHRIAHTKGRPHLETAFAFVLKYIPEQSAEYEASQMRPNAGRYLVGCWTLRVRPKTFICFSRVTPSARLRSASGPASSGHAPWR